MSPVYYTYDKEWLTIQADAIKYALKHADEAEKPKVVCSDHGYDKAAAVDVSFIKSLADIFCDGDAKKDRHMTLSGNDISPKTYRKYTFDLTYAPPEKSDEECFTDCAGAIDAMAATCILPTLPRRMFGDHGCANYLNDQARASTATPCREGQILPLVVVRSTATRSIYRTSPRTRISPAPMTGYVSHPATMSIPSVSRHGLPLLI